MNEDLNTPLSEDDMQTLDMFLANLDGEVPSFEALDGLFCALRCAPSLVPPSGYLPVLLGEDDGFEDEDQARTMLTLITRHWNTVSAGLREAMETQTLYLPALLVDDKDQATGNDWAEGFLLGVSMTEDDWDDFIDDEDLGELLVPMMVLAHEDDPDPEFKSPEITDENRESLLNMMFNSLMLIFAHFEKQRHR
jgi:uncharacterized protein|uniref:UPF0149 family protein n=1 Tax=Orrella sp. TaxID=1921583 RepID=UPI0040473D55